VGLTLRTEDYIILSELDNYDWQEAFNYVYPPQVVLGDSCSDAGFTRDDVIEILAIEDGENDGGEWIGIFRLSDGRFAFVAAGCDCTGWDCQAGGYSQVAGSLESLVRFGVGECSRRRFGLCLPEDHNPYDVRTFEEFLEIYNHTIDPK
jgi:hypothetical protein